MNRPDDLVLAGEQRVAGGAALGAARLAERDPAAEVRDRRRRRIEVLRHVRHLEQRRQRRRVRQMYLAQTDAVAHEYRQRFHSRLAHHGFRAPQE